MCTQNDVLLIAASLAISGATWIALLDSITHFV